MSSKISVITVCYNVVDSIEETMLSVLNQTYDNIEYVIIDGGSTDGTVDIIKKYAGKLSYWISESDNGIYDAMNKGIDIATGEYINFMNSGDIFYTNTVIYDVFHSRHTNAEIIYGDTVYKTKWGEYLEQTLPLNEMQRRMPFGHQSTFVKTSLMKEVRFDTSYRSSADYKFLYNCYKEHRQFLYIPIIISKYDLTKGMSLDNYRTKLREDGRIWGLEKNTSWKIHYYRTVLVKDIKKFIKHLIPDTIIASYQRKKIHSQNIHLKK